MNILALIGIGNTNNVNLKVKYIKYFSWLFANFSTFFNDAMYDI